MYFSRIGVDFTSINKQTSKFDEFLFPVINGHYKSRSSSWTEKPEARTVTAAYISFCILIVVTKLFFDGNRSSALS